MRHKTSIPNAVIGGITPNPNTVAGGEKKRREMEQMEEGGEGKERNGRNGGGMKKKGGSQ